MVRCGGRVTGAKRTPNGAAAQVRVFPGARQASTGCDGRVSRARPHGTAYWPSSFLSLKAVGKNSNPTGVALEQAD